MKVQIASRLFAGVFWLVQESSWSSSSRLRIQDDPNKKGSTSRTILQCVCSVLRLVLKSVGVIMAIIISFFALYYFAASPPLHLFYDVAPPAGPASVYLPGGGFSGFWFHLGYLHSVDNVHDFDYYCFSAGCLSILSVFMNRTLDDVSNAAFSAQEAWTNGNLTRFDLVDHFFDELVPESIDDDKTVKELLPKIKILVTTASDGFRVVEATNRQALKDSIMKTTWVPYLTGWGFLSSNDEHDNEVYLDGGFSRLLHPRCETELHLPIIWETLVHTFSPGLTRNQVQELWNAGYRYQYPLPTSSSTTKGSL